MRSKWIDLVRKAVMICTIDVVTITVFDLTLWVLPVRFNVFPPYKEANRLENPASGGYPQRYCQNSDVRGFTSSPQLRAQSTFAMLMQVGFKDIKMKAFHASQQDGFHVYFPDRKP